MAGNVQRAPEIARRLVDEFGSLGAIMAANRDRLYRIAGENWLVPSLIQCARAAMVHCLREKLDHGPMLASSEALTDYLTGRLAHEPVEQFHVLFLNSAARLLRDETLGQGSVNQAPIYPREVVRRALELGATALILVHNHPSGDPTPSRQDIQVTADLAAAASLFGITIFDHVIVACGGHVSFRAHGLLDRSGPG